MFVGLRVVKQGICQTQQNRNLLVSAARTFSMAPSLSNARVIKQEPLVSEAHRCMVDTC